MQQTILNETARVERFALPMRRQDCLRYMHAISPGGGEGWIPTVMRPPGSLERMVRQNHLS